MNNKLDYINQNLDFINNQIKTTCTKFNRDYKSIKLLAVTKNVEIEKINYLKSLGISHFGENKSQELVQKFDKISDANWHFIGRLQTNKVKYIIDKVSLIHSIDSFKLALEVNKRATTPKDVLVQVNIANEKTKTGIDPKHCMEFIDSIANFDKINIKGLMCIAPFSTNPEHIRPYFENMQKLFVDIGAKNKHNITMKYLSMGMSNDYKIAIEYGSNIIRLGTAIFENKN